MKTVRQGAGGERKGIPFSGTSRMTTFLGGQKRWTHRVLPKEEKHVRGREVVVRHGGGDRGYLLHVTVLHKTLWLSQTLCGTAWRNTQKRSVKGK